MSRYVVDSNILIYIANEQSPYYQESLQAVITLRARGDQLFITPQIALEFWNIATSLKKNGLRWPVHRAAAALSIYTSAFFQLLDDPGNLFDEWYRICFNDKVAGITCYDARIVALMTIYGITKILTKNTKHFSSFRNVTAVDPATV